MSFTTYFMFTIPTSFTQGDRVTWTQRLQGYSSLTDTVSCFIRGQSSLDLTATGNLSYTDEWDFEISSIQSMALVTFSHIRVARLNVGERHKNKINS